jgi:hypothetical protein
MATGATPLFDLPFPLLSDVVNVHGDIQALAEQVELILPGLGLPYVTYEVKNSSGVTINKGDPVYATGYSTKTTVAKSVGVVLRANASLGVITVGSIKGNGTWGSMKAGLA